MTNTSHSADAAAAEAKAKAAEAAKGAPMKDADLDQVAGGINPQPLPPIVKRPQ